MEVRKHGVALDYHWKTLYRNDEIEQYGNYKERLWCIGKMFKRQLQIMESVNETVVDMSDKVSSLNVWNVNIKLGRRLREIEEQSQDMRSLKYQLSESESMKNKLREELSWKYIKNRNKKVKI